MRKGVVVDLNGERVELPVGTTVEGAVAHLHASSRGCAVARNGEVVPRSAWGEAELHPGDRLEIVTATAGG